MDSRSRRFAIAAAVPTAMLVTGVVQKRGALKRFLSLGRAGRQCEPSVTPVDIAKAVAAEHGYFGCTDNEADFALRERTAYPECPVDEMAEQLDEYFAGRTDPRAAASA
jgi:hypothetical protein